MKASKTLRTYQGICKISEVVCYVICIGFIIHLSATQNPFPIYVGNVIELFIDFDLMSTFTGGQATDPDGFAKYF